MNYTLVNFCNDINFKITENHKWPWLAFLCLTYESVVSTTSVKRAMRGQYVWRHNLGKLNTNKYVIPRCLHLNLWSR